MMDLKDYDDQNSFNGNKKQNWSAKKRKNKINVDCMYIPNKGGLCRSFSRLYFFVLFFFFMAARLRLCSGNTKTLKIPHRHTTNSCCTTHKRTKFFLLKMATSLSHWNISNIFLLGKTTKQTDNIFFFLFDWKKKKMGKKVSFLLKNWNFRSRHENSIEIKAFADL